MFKREIEAGAEALDEADPGWELRIDVSKLTMASCFDCVLGQCFLDRYLGYEDPYAYGLDVLNLHSDGDSGESTGFDLPQWARHAIRVAVDETNDFNVAEDLRAMFYNQLGDEWGAFIKKRLDTGLKLS